MSVAEITPSFPLLFSSSIFLLTLFLFTSPSASGTGDFVFSSCSQMKYLPGSLYENAVNSILTSFVNNSMFATYSSFTVPVNTTYPDTIYGLFQCSGDLNQSTCSRCVTRAFSQLGTFCTGACGGTLQLEGCFVKYDNSSFLGVEDKTVVYKKCGPESTSYDSDELNSLLRFLLRNRNDRPVFHWRVHPYGSLAVLQCVQELSPMDCGDCIVEAIDQLASNCGAARWADMFLAKCYVRLNLEGRDSLQGGYPSPSPAYPEGGYHSPGHAYSEDGNHSHGGHSRNRVYGGVDSWLRVAFGLIWLCSDLVYMDCLGWI